MKRLLKLVIITVALYVAYRLASDYVRSERLATDEPFGTPDLRRVPPPPSPSSPSPTAPDVLPLLVDLNHADAATLAGLPGIGRALAERITLHRDLFGAFSNVDELADVRGIGPSLVERLKSRVTV